MTDPRTGYADTVELLRRQLDELADRETRLLSIGIGDHYPHETLVNVAGVRSERAQLLAFTAR